MPDVPWFGDSFTGSEVSFTKPDPSTWRLKEKISENADHETEEGARKLEMCLKLELSSSARELMVLCHKRLR